MSAHRLPRDLLLAEFAGEDPGDAKTITIDRWGIVVPLVSSSSSETRTLAQPTRAGLVCTLAMDTDGGGDIVVTVTGGYNQAAATSITFGDAGDFVRFQSIKIGSSYYWRVIQYEGTGLTVAELTVTSLTATAATATSLKLAVSAVNAAGSVIGNAAALAAGLNVVAGADNSKGVQLPAASAGLVAIVKSTTASKILKVYPQVNSAIDALGANNAYSTAAVANGAAVMFVASNATTWRSLPGDIT